MHIGLLDRNVNVVFLGISSWGEGWVQGLVGAALVPSQWVARWRTVLPAGAYCVSRLMATSLCVQLNMDQGKEIDF